MIRTPKWLHSASLILILPPIFVQAQTDNQPPLAELDRLVAERQYEQAYQLANDSLEEWEGDTDFDLLYGLAALESGRPNEAVFALERVSNTAPQSTTRQRARLELARAHFTSNNLVAADTLFRRVLESDPPPNVRQNILVFLDLIEIRQLDQRRNTMFSVSTNVGHDTNVNSSTANSLIDTPLIGDIELDPTGRKTADQFYDLNFGLNHHTPFTRNLALDAGAAYNRRKNFSTSTFDLDTLRANAVLTQTRGNHRFRYGIQGQRAWLDGTGFQQSVGANAAWQRAGNNGWYQSVTGSITAIRYDNTSNAPRNNLRDVNQALLSGGLIHIDNQFTNSINVYYADESARNSTGRHNGRSFAGVAHNLVWRMNNQHHPYSRISVQDVRHKANHPVFFDRTRSDTLLSATAGWNWHYNRQLRISGELMYMRANSNIVLFDYNRVRYQVGMRYQLHR